MPHTSYKMMPMNDLLPPLLRKFIGIHVFLFLLRRKNDWDRYRDDGEDHAAVATWPEFDQSRHFLYTDINPRAGLAIRPDQLVLSA
jgi:hypothetical protein